YQPHFGTPLHAQASQVMAGRPISIQHSTISNSAGLVTHGPYHWRCPPIYAAILYFVWSTAVDHRSLQSVAAALLVTAGAGVRMYAEESLLTTTYPEYAAYRVPTRRGD